MNGSKFLLDGCAEVRNHAKGVFSVLKRHKRFESVLFNTLNENQRKGIKKMLDSIR